MSKWPKHIPELSETEQKTREDWMKYWHEKLPAKYGIVEKFNHLYPVNQHNSSYAPRGGGRYSHA
jgi:hypothetical protein